MRALVLETVEHLLVVFHNLAFLLDASTLIQRTRGSKLSFTVILKVRVDIKGALHDRRHPTLGVFVAHSLLFSLRSSKDPGHSF